MFIKELENKDIKNYEKINKIYGFVFTSIKWIKIFNFLNTKIFGIYNKNNELIGGFVLWKKSYLGLTIYRNPPLTPYIFWIKPPESNKLVTIQTYYKNILETLAKFFGKKLKNIIYVSFPPTIIDFQPFLWKGFKASPRYTYCLELKYSTDTLKSFMSPERRNDIKKAIKDKLYCVPINNKDRKKTALELILKTFKRQNKKIDIRIFENVIFEFLNTETGFGFITYNKNEEPLATSICVYDSKTAYYILGGYDNDNKHHGAGALALWNCIIEAKKKNLKIFDFEGSMIPNIEKYFRGFGGKLTPYFSVCKAPFLLECFLKLVKRSIF